MLLLSDDNIGDDLKLALIGCSRGVESLCCVRSIEEDDDDDEDAEREGNEWVVTAGDAGGAANSWAAEVNMNLDTNVSGLNSRFALCAGERLLGCCCCSSCGLLLVITASAVSFSNDCIDNVLIDSNNERCCCVDVVKAADVSASISALSICWHPVRGDK